MTASERWLAAELGTERACGRVSTTDEVKYFEDNYKSFKAEDVGKDANGFSFISWCVHGQPTCSLVLPSLWIIMDRSSCFFALVVPVLLSCVCGLTGISLQPRGMLSVLVKTQILRWRNSA